MPDRLVQQDAGPAGAEHHLHLPGRGRHALEVDQRLAQRLLDGALPALLAEDAVVGEAAAHAVAAGLPPAVLLHHHADVQPHQRPQVRDARAVRAQDLHRLPLAGDRGHHLPHARVAPAGVGVDLAQQPGLLREAEGGEGVRVLVEPGVGRARAKVERPGPALPDGGDRLRRAPQRRLRQLARMGVAGGLAGDGAQAEAPRRVEGGGADPAVVERDALALAVLQEQLPVLRAGEGVAQRGLGRGAVQAPGGAGIAASEEQAVGDGERGIERHGTSGSLDGAAGRAATGVRRRRRGRRAAPSGSAAPPSCPRRGRSPAPARPPGPPPARARGRGRARSPGTGATARRRAG